MSDQRRSLALAAEEEIPGLIRPTRHNGTKRHIGDVILYLGLADHEDVEEAIERSLEGGKLTGQLLLEAGALDSRQLARALAERNALNYVDLDVFPVDMGAANLIDMAAARRYRCLPIAFVDDSTILVATADPANVLAADDIAMVTGYDVARAVAPPEDIDALIGQLSRLAQSMSEVEAETQNEAKAQVIELRESAEQAPIVKLVYSIVSDAVERGASDIHFDPTPTGMSVRFRVDGVVSESTTVPRHLVAGLVSRIKVMAELDISVRRTPQDGRVGISVSGRPIDIRIATLPVVRGEAVVMRILDKEGVVLDLDTLGIEGDDRERFDRAIRASHGAVLVTGPTGSGKTTTLYAALSEINTPEKTLITIEDPVEYELDGVKQIQVSGKAGLTFASGLRSMVRSDPDVLMVGEIRDRETAQIAIESALTGHLVLSTLHTNDAPLAAARLIEMGTEPFLVASGLECVVAQRLARRLCDCKREVEIAPELLVAQGFETGTDPVTVFEPVGCVRCGRSGYRGRVGIYEVMGITEELRRLILTKADGDTLRGVARKQGMRTLHEGAFEKIKAGVTDLNEALRVLGTASA